MGCSGGMETEDEKKKLNDDMVVFMRKRSETDAPHYTARLKRYVDLQQKRRRAAAARRHSEHGERKSSASRKKGDTDQKDKTGDSAGNPNCDQDEDGRVIKRRGEKCMHGRSRSVSQSRSLEPMEGCCRRRRRRRSCCRRRRRRSCRRRRRRSCRRRRRRSCRRRRRRCRRRCPRRCRRRRRC